jgi:Na+-driven multidrug efflux pump
MSRNALSSKNAPTSMNAVGPRQVIHIAWPVMVSMLSYTAMSLVDTLYVGRLGTEALAAVGLAIPVFLLLVFFGQGVLRAVKVTVAQATGAEDHDTARAMAWQGIWAAVVLSGLVLALLPLLPVSWFSRCLSKPGSPLLNAMDSA